MLRLVASGMPMEDDAAVACQTRGLPLTLHFPATGIPNAWIIATDYYLLLHYYIIRIPVYPYPFPAYPEQEVARGGPI
jgi:hypothetical protein